MKTLDEHEEESRELTFWEILGSTFAGALGVQSFKNRQRDFTQGNIIHFIISGIVFTAAFAVVILLLIRYSLA
ncbi:MAG: DUF2970 domain-containing protein [Pseudomonadales bacterium]